MRELIYVPVIHTEVDMGTMLDLIKKEYLAKYGEEKWQQHLMAINSMWDGIREKIFNLNLPYKRTRIYQDGLPVCGKEIEIVREIAMKGSLNHKIILDLVMLGAKLEGTEDPDLLAQEYNNLKKLCQDANMKEKRSAMREYRRMAEELLLRRDKFIAKRIESTLAEDEIGILFMGLMHTVDKYLIGIKISYLIHRLPFRESYEVTIPSKKSVQQNKRQENKNKL